MKKKFQKIKIIIAGIFLALSTPIFMQAAGNPNYGTTTFFSGQSEKPVLEKPILGAEKGEVNDDDDDDNNNDNEEEDNNDDGIFDQIGETVNVVVDTSVNTFNETKKSLFDLQSEFDDGDSSADDDFNEKDEFFISGPRGESPEYMATLREREGSGQTVEFNFEDRSLKVAPKKSKLIFTNKEVSVDMTSQYMALGVIFVMAMSMAIGYYYWRKELGKNKESDL